jgi:hypothetical protein
MKTAIVDKNGIIQCIFDFIGDPENFPVEDGNQLLVGIEEFITFDHKWNGKYFEKIDKDTEEIEI